MSERRREWKYRGERHGLLRFSVVLFASLSVCRWASADLPADEAKMQARAHFIAGNAFLEANRHDVAIEEFLKAYRLLPKPDFLFNVGQAYRLMGNRNNARQYYSLYLKEAPKGRGADEAREHLTQWQNEAEEQRRQQEAAAAKAAAAKAAAAKEEAAAKEAAATKEAAAKEAARSANEGSAREAAARELAAREVAARESAATKNRSPRAGRRSEGAMPLKIAGGALLAAGLGVAVAGVTFSVLAQQTASDITRALEYDPRQYATYQTDQILGGVLAGVGAVALIAGVATLAVGMKRPAPAPSVRLVPTLGPGHLGLSAALHF